jgi:hypothetical protein
MLREENKKTKTEREQRENNAEKRQEQATTAGLETRIWISVLVLRLQVSKPPFRPSWFVPVHVLDDLEKYLAGDVPTNVNMELDVLAWWKAEDARSFERRDVSGCEGDSR